MGGGGAAVGVSPREGVGGASPSSRACRGTAPVLGGQGTWEPAILCSNGPKPAYSLRITSTPVHLLQSGLRHWQVCKDLGLVGWMSVCVCEVP